MKKEKCIHKKIKRIYNHGDKSPYLMKCKDCGKIIKKIDTKEKRKSHKIKKPRRKHGNNRNL